MNPRKFYHENFVLKEKSLNLENFDPRNICAIRYFERLKFGDLTPIRQILQFPLAKISVFTVLHVTYLTINIIYYGSI